METQDLSELYDVIPELSPSQHNISWEFTDTPIIVIDDSVLSVKQWTGGTTMHLEMYVFEHWRVGSFIKHWCY